MYKNGSKLAWVKEKNGVVTCIPIEISPGRKCQVIKRLVQQEIKNGNISDSQLIFFLRRSETIPTTRMIALALTPNKYIGKEEGEEDD